MLQTRSGKRTGYAAVVIATDFVAEKLVTPKEAILLVDPEVAQPAARAGLRSRRVEEDSGRDQGAAGIAGRRERPGRVLGRSRGRMGERGQAGDSRAARDGAGRHPRHVRGAGHPDRDRRHDVARRGRRPPDGQAVGRRRRRRSRSTRRRRQFRVDGKTVKEGDFISFDGLTGEVKLATGGVQAERDPPGAQRHADAEEVGHLPAVRAAALLGRQVPAPGRPRQRRPAGSGGARVRVRRARHRPVPHRAHVLRRGAHPDRPADDPRRQRSRSPARRSNELLPLQREDFYGVFKAMHGCPVTIRTIDPPLHEFLPKREDLMVDVARLEATGKKRAPSSSEKRRLLAARRAAPRVQPDARPPRRPSRHHLPRDHRDADARDHRGGLPAEQGRASRSCPRS